MSLSRTVARECRDTKLFIDLTKLLSDQRRIDFQLLIIEAHGNRRNNPRIRGPPRCCGHRRRTVLDPRYASPPPVPKASPKASQPPLH